ncbi:hypothetical protein [Neobacillus sp. NPDC093127]|uniref:hypothetical protein n=1 Tax=Neobacillus sp. NPDC093127 TaxID=3364296 RepID=UPI0038108AD1
MIYGIGYRDFTAEQGHNFIIQKHITKEEYNNHTTMLGEVNKINAMDNVYNLLYRNGEELLEYFSKISEKLATDKESIYLDANRLLINFLSSLSMFIDYGERYNKKHFGKARMKEFQETTHDFYDNHVSYRFIALMRNFALHYGFPLSVIKQSVNGPKGIFASRESLLQFKSWKHATEDIQRMPELISLEPHIEISMMFIKHLYQDFIYDIAPVILKGIEYLNTMIKQNGGKIPLLASYKNIEEFNKGNIHFNIIEPEPYHDALKIIKSHPSINIIVK